MIDKKILREYEQACAIIHEEESRKKSNEVAACASINNTGSGRRKAKRCASKDSKDDTIQICARDDMGRGCKKYRREGNRGQRKEGN